MLLRLCIPRYTYLVFVLLNSHITLAMYFTKVVEYNICIEYYYYNTSQFKVTQILKRNLYKVAVVCKDATQIKPPYNYLQFYKLIG